jgi:hypothetical protein
MIGSPPPASEDALKVLAGLIDLIGDPSSGKRVRELQIATKESREAHAKFTAEKAAFDREREQILEDEFQRAAEQKRKLDDERHAHQQQMTIERGNSEKDRTEAAALLAEAKADREVAKKLRADLDRRIAIIQGA